MGCPDLYVIKTLANTFLWNVDTFRATGFIVAKNCAGCKRKLRKGVVVRTAESRELFFCFGSCLDLFCSYLSAPEIPGRMRAEASMLEDGECPIDQTEHERSIAIAYPEFHEVFRSYSAGDIKSDEMLSSIFRQVFTDGMEPSPRQVRAAVTRAKVLLGTASKGRTPSPQAPQGRTETIVDLAGRFVRDRPCHSGVSFLESVLGFHGKRGYLTERQVAVAEKILRKARK